VHFLQIWLLPEREGMSPGYEQRTFPTDEKRGMLRLVGSHDGRDGSVTIHQDVDLFATVLDAGEEVTHPLQHGRHAWAQLVRGAISIDGAMLAAGDGVAVTNERTVSLRARDRSEILLFDLA